MRLSRLIGCVFASSLAACFLGGNPTGDNSDGGPSTDDAGDIPPFQADSANVYVSKVKNVLTGLRATDAEVEQVVADPAAFVTLVDQWMKLPEYQSKMLELFALSFQQTQIGISDFQNQIPIGPGGIGQSPLIPLLVQNAQESFARTAFEIVQAGRPFTDVFTTTTYMMTPPLLELYAFMDVYQVGNTPTQIKDTSGVTKFTVEESAGPIPIAQTLDPSDSAHCLHWYFPDLKTVDKNPACDVDPRTYSGAHALHELMYGQLDGYTAGTTKCQIVAGTGANAQLTTDDFSNWRMVNVRQPKVGETTTRFFDTPALHTATELVLDTPRVSFYTTPAFFANWNTNTSNEMRVTVNQAFIVATSTQVDGTDPTVPAQTPGLDAQHAGSQPCLGCHQTLDPSRAIFQATYSYDYGPQSDPTLSAQPGQFTYRGVIAPVNTIYDFGKLLASHALVPEAWAQKLCYWINSQACASDDPEFQRIVGDFRNGLSWTKLVEELATSPITTNASFTKTAQEEGELVAVSRKYHLCTALDARLGLTDVCGLDLTKTVYSGIPVIASGLPADQYGRGTPVPVLPNEPSMFYRAALENICEDVAAMVVDPATTIPGAKVYLSTSQATVDAAVADLVMNLLGLVASDPRANAVQDALSQHYKDAIGQGVKPTDALQSTFTLACLTPSVVGIGM